MVPGNQVQFEFKDEKWVLFTATKPASDSFWATKDSILQNIQKFLGEENYNSLLDHLDKDNKHRFVFSTHITVPKDGVPVNQFIYCYSLLSDEICIDTDLLDYFRKIQDPKLTMAPTIYYETKLNMETVDYMAHYDVVQIHLGKTKKIELIELFYTSPR
jgi:hypothetical protein